MTQRPFQIIPHEGTHAAPEGAGVSPSLWEPGDFFLVHHKKNPISRLIRFGQAIRIHGEDRKYCHWNHAVLIIDDEGNTVEALGKGVSRQHISAYDGVEYVLVNVKASEPDRQQIIDFGQQVVGLQYGFLTIGSIAFSVLTGGKFIFSMEDQLICSGLVARSQERAGALFNRNPDHIMPADLAKYYQVERAV